MRLHHLGYLACFHNRHLLNTQIAPQHAINIQILAIHVAVHTNQSWPRKAIFFRWIMTKNWWEIEGKKNDDDEQESDDERNRKDDYNRRWREWNQEKNERPY